MPGTYKVLEIVDYGIAESENGNPKVSIRFRHEHGEGSRELTWNGYLTEKAKEKTIEQLLKAGFKGSNPFSLAEPNAFDPKDDITIVVENNTYEGKTQLKVKWINNGYQMHKSEPSEALKILEGLNLEGDFMAAREKMGLKPDVQKGDFNDPTYNPDF